VVVFSGGYHGAVLAFDDDGKPTANTVDAADWVGVKYNDVEAARKAIEETEGVAAVMAEGMQGAAGCIMGTREFLQQVQESAKNVSTHSPVLGYSLSNWLGMFILTSLFL
jgi:glutamate-1-semialdehyde 2,1-aminomutase